MASFPQVLLDVRVKRPQDCAAAGDPSRAPPPCSAPSVIYKYPPALPPLASSPDSLPLSTFSLLTLASPLKRKAPKQNTSRKKNHLICSLIPPWIFILNHTTPRIPSPRSPQDFSWIFSPDFLSYFRLGDGLIAIPRRG